MAFRGWPAEAIEFYEGLEADNTRAYWQDHKKEYEELVKGPMVELLAELAGEFGEGKIFRPFRDVRFSKDKSPYKTAIGATLERGGYVQFSAHGLAAGSGYYGMMPDQLERYRQAVADDKSGRKVVELVRRPAEGRRRRHRPGDAEDGAQGLPEGPSPHRTVAPQGPHRLEAVAGGRLDGYRQGQAAGRRLPRRRPPAEPVARHPRGARRVSRRCRARRCASRARASRRGEPGGRRESP